MKKDIIFDLVKQLLETEQNCRNSYRETQWRVLEVKLGRPLYSLTKDQFKLMNNESVRRSWQKCRQLYPWLKGDPSIEAKRKEIERQRGTWIFREEVKREPVQVNLFA